VSRHYSRDFECQADRLANKVPADNAIYSANFTNILNSIEEIYKDHQRVPTHFSTHPTTEERISYINEIKKK